LVHPKGLEPPSSEPESNILSIKLRVHFICNKYTIVQQTIIDFKNILLIWIYNPNYLTNDLESAFYLA